MSDHVFYVQDSQKKTAAKQDVFSFYISDGHSQTEAFNIEINIQVGGAQISNVTRALLTPSLSRVGE